MCMQLEISPMQLLVLLKMAPTSSTADSIHLHAWVSIPHVGCFLNGFALAEVQLLYGATAILHWAFILDIVALR